MRCVLLPVDPCFQGDGRAENEGVAMDVVSDEQKEYLVRQTVQASIVETDDLRQQVGRPGKEIDR